MNETPRIAACGPQVVDDLTSLARLAYIYGFPSYEMARLRFQAFSRSATGEPARPDTFRHARILATPATSGITAVNSDTLFSVAWLDLTRCPLIMHVPDTAGRYYSLALMDFFTNNFAVLGRRTTGTAAAQFLLAGPQWDGVAPKGDAAILRAPTNAVRAIIRILVDGPDDLAAARALQEQFTIVPASQPPETAPPAAPLLPVPLSPLDEEDPLAFFDVLNAVLSENPPPPEDSDVLACLRTIGVGPHLQFNRSAFDDDQRHALVSGLVSAREIVGQPGRRPFPADSHFARLLGQGAQGAQDAAGPRQIGWTSPPVDVGNFGKNYLLRARYALSGFGALPREEAMYFTTARDAAGTPLHGRSRYVINFPAGGLPPVDAFWSLTVYRTDENKRRWLVPNAINRYSLGDRTPHLRYGPDGSLKIFIQHQRPMMNEENWLPAPRGPFLVTLRTYQPRQDLLDGRYVIPRLQRR